MSPVNSPLGALGALMVLLQGVAVGALFALDSQPGLQLVFAYMMVVSISLVTGLVLTVVGLFAWKRPLLLFDPARFSPDTQIFIYGPPGIFVEPI